jgi:hypothetical protein
LVERSTFLISNNLSHSSESAICSTAGLNLGLTSFFDGFGPTDGGFTYQLYLTFANATAIYDCCGDEVAVVRDPRISIFAVVNQLSHFLPESLFGGAVRPGIDFVLRLLMFDTSFGAGWASM